MAGAGQDGDGGEGRSEGCREERQEAGDGTDGSGVVQQELPHLLEGFPDALKGLAEPPRFLGRQFVVRLVELLGDCVGFVPVLVLQGAGLGDDVRVRLVGVVELGGRLVQ